MILTPFFGSEVKEQVLQYILENKKAYAKEIADYWENKSPSSVQKQLDALEQGGILVSFKIGRMRLYEFNSNYLLLDEIKSLLQKAREFYPKEKRLIRTRPRRKNKPLELIGA